jgi:hypothetical protein
MTEEAFHLIAGFVGQLRRPEQFTGLVTITLARFRLPPDHPHHVLDHTGIPGMAWAMLVGRGGWT